MTSKEILNWKKAKDPDEVEAVRSSCELVDYAHAVIKELTSEGLTELEAYARSYHKVIERPGINAAEVYQAIFHVIQESGYDSKFTHHGGHCVGLDAWEPPFIIPGSKERMTENEVCALEPGVYIPEIGGMRIEDDYLITSNGVRALSKFPLDL